MSSPTATDSEITSNKNSKEINNKQDASPKKEKQVQLLDEVCILYFVFFIFYYFIFFLKTSATPCISLFLNKTIFFSIFF